MVKITKSERGFSQYGKPTKDIDRVEYKVVQSSVNLSACRLYIDDPELYFPHVNGKIAPSLHLNREQASGLIERLQAFLEDTK